MKVNCYLSRNQLLPSTLLHCQPTDLKFPNLELMQKICSSSGIGSEDATLSGQLLACQLLSILGLRTLKNFWL